MGAEQDGRYEDEGWRMRKDGSRFWANVIITALRDSDGTLIGFAKVTRDLTERRRHEESLRHSESRFRSLVEGVRDYAIFMLDTEGCVTTWNAGASADHGLRHGDESWANTSPSSIRATAASGNWPHTELRTATAEGRFEDEGWRVRKDGSRFWANVVLTAIRDTNGNLMGFSKITRDLSERREHENSLRESEARFRVLVDSVVDYAIITVDDEGFVNSWNTGAERITGFGAAEIIGKHFSRLYPPEDVAANKPWRQLIRASRRNPRQRGRLAPAQGRLAVLGQQRHRPRCPTPRAAAPATTW